MVSRGMFDELATRAQHMRDHLATEEATKHALVLPFIQSLGYDVFNPLEVVPEYIADYGIKNGEKVDYAIMRAGQPAIVIECKKAGDSLDITRASQLARYFTYTSAGIAILTDGIVYQFFSDLDADNTMDTAPFYEFDLAIADRSRVCKNLDQFAKSTFDMETVRTTAAEMKHISGMKSYLTALYNAPDDDFVRLLAKRVYSGPLTQSRMEHFSGLSKLAFQGFFNDYFHDRFRRAASDQSEPDETPIVETPEPVRRVGNVVTTPDEVAAFETVQQILSEHVDPARLELHDTPYYSTIRIVGHRYGICRLRIQSRNVEHWHVEILGENGARHPISNVQDIALYADELIAAAKVRIGQYGD